MDQFNDAGSLNEAVNQIMSTFGFESHPFLVDWYNQLVSDKFKLDYDGDTVACILISQPSMFEKAFLPFLRQEYDAKEVRDPIDQCMLHYFSIAKDSLRARCVEDIVSLHDFELDRRRRPKILVQTAGHVSGAVRFYKSCDVEIEKSNNNYYPVCHHPRWGGWFALRGVLIFPGIKDPNLRKQEPPNNLSKVDAGAMLELYNRHWQDWRWRDIGSPEQKYSQPQIKYFETEPAERFKLISQYLAESRD